MRRAFLWYAAMPVALAGIAGCAQRAGQRPDVSVTITCPDPGFVLVNYRGWVVHRNPGEDVVIQVARGANLSSITINPKLPGSWPFTQPPPYVVVPGGQQLLTVNADAQPGTYSYVLEGTCTPPNDTAQTVRIDPDIVVD